MSAQQLCFDLESTDGAEELANIDRSLAGHYREGCNGRNGVIRNLLLKHRAALLGQWHDGAVVPSDIRFIDLMTDPDLLGTCGAFHSWAICDRLMEMSGGTGNTRAAARADAMVGLMLEVNSCR